MRHCHVCLIETRCLVTITTIGCVFSLHFLVLLSALAFLHKISNFWFRNWLLHGWHFWFGPSGLPSLTFCTIPLNLPLSHIFLPFQFQRTILLFSIHFPDLPYTYSLRIFRFCFLSFYGGIIEVFSLGYRIYCSSSRTIHCGGPIHSK